MPGEHVTDTLNGLFKEIYADAIEDAKPKGMKWGRDISFVARNKMPGNEFHTPISLSHEHGFTYLPANATTLTLNEAIAHNLRDARVIGTQCIMRSRISYEVAARASSGGPRAFRMALDVVVENMNDSFRKRCEIDYGYGQRGLGQIRTAPTAQANMTLQTASFAPGIWAGMENARVEIFSTTGATATKRGATATVTSVNVLTRVIGISTAAAPATVDDHVFFEGQRTANAHNVYQGLDALVTATTGVVHNISVATWSLWQGNSRTAAQLGSGTTLSFSKVNNAIALAVGKGLDEDMTMYIHPEVWVDLLNDEAALRRHNAPRDYDVGADGITFFSQNGTITIKASIYVKLGRAYLIAPRYWRRVGATDITFRLPDRGDEFFRHVENAAAYELRAYVNQAMFTRALSKSLVITGITS